jgi:hypothetical protein
MLDPELEAMVKCHEQLNLLDAGAKGRVIQWLISKYELNSSANNFVSPPNNKQPQDSSLRLITTQSTEANNDIETLIAVPQTANVIDSFESLADFFCSSKPKF